MPGRSRGQAKGLNCQICNNLNNEYRIYSLSLDRLIDIIIFALVFFFAGILYIYEAGELWITFPERGIEKYFLRPMRRLSL